MRAARREIRSNAKRAGPDALVNCIELHEGFTLSIIKVNRVGNAPWVIASRESCCLIGLKVDVVSSSRRIRKNKGRA
jgi:hypothetical protein